MSIACTHCGLPVPAGLIEPNAAEQFCCNGCRAVYAVIHQCGLDRFYKLREAAGADGQAARTTNRQYAEFDDPVFRELYFREAIDGSTSAELYLEGVHCAACVWLVEKLPQVLPGVVVSRLDLRRSLLRVTWDDERVHLSRIARTLDSLGYPPHPAKDAAARELRKQEDRRFLIRIGVAAACAGNVMTLAFALYGGMFSGIEAEYEHYFRWVSLLIGLVALLWPGSLFFRGAWAALRTHTAHLDLPIALGLLAGGTAGLVNVICGTGEIYFDSLTMLIFLLLVGRWIQRRQQRWANDAVELLYSLTPTSVRRIEGDVVRDVPVEAVNTDDILEVRAGDSIAVDGIVTDGTTTIDQSLLTGETRAVEVAPGDAVAAGTLNVAARVLVHVAAVGAQTRVGRLMQLVEECSRQRAPLVRFADRVAGWFVVTVLSLAALTFGVWLWIAPERATGHAVALLIVTCPCALGLATPLTVTVAIGRAAKRGILIKGGEALEALARRGRMILDKTGTLTAGATRLVAWHGTADIKPMVAALERRSSHPIAQAFVAAFADDSQCEDPPKIENVRQTTGGGITGLVDGHSLAIGSPAFVRESGASVPDDLRAAEQDIIEQAHSPVFVACDDAVVAVAGFGDPIRDDAHDALQTLRDTGWQTEIASGDHASVVESVARALDFAAGNAHGGLSPEEKLELIRVRATDGAAIMVGDGVNDAAALSAATVGVAVHGGAEVSLAAADVYLSRPGLRPVVALMQAARRTVATIHRGLFVSLCYNAIAATLAMTGLIGPLIAAVLMPISSFSVLALAFASPTFGDDECR